MTPRLEACYFSAIGSDGRWTRLSRVLEWTARRHCPSWHVNVELITPAPASSVLNIRAYETNTSKLDRWAEIVAAAEDGEHLLLIDADTMILRTLDDIWEYPFDLAYTTKRARFPLNGGVIFLRVSNRVKAFMAAWAVQNRARLADDDRAADWRFTHGGVNQAALAQLLDTDHGLHLLALPCAEWNCEDSAWASFNPDITRIVHIKSALRQACLTGFTYPDELNPLRELWRTAEREARSRALSEVS